MSKCEHGWTDEQGCDLCEPERVIAERNELRSRLDDALNNRVSGDIWRASQVDMRHLRDRLAKIHELMTAVHETTLGRAADVVERVLDEVTRLSAVETSVPIAKPCGVYWKFFGYQQGPCALHDGHEGSHNEQCPIV